MKPPRIKQLKRRPTNNDGSIDISLAPQAATSLLHVRGGQSAEEGTTTTIALLKRTDGDDGIGVDFLDDNKPATRKIPRKSLGKRMLSGQELGKKRPHEVIESDDEIDPDNLEDNELPTGESADKALEELIQLDAELGKKTRREPSRPRPALRPRFREREYPETDNGRAQGMSHTPNAAGQTSTTVVPTSSRSEQVHWGDMRLDDPANWVSSSAYLQPLDEYPNEAEANEFLDNMNTRLFSQFHSGRFVRSLEINFKFGPLDKYSCRAVCKSARSVSLLLWKRSILFQQTDIHKGSILRKKYMGPNIWPLTPPTTLSYWIRSQGGTNKSWFIQCPSATCQTTYPTTLTQL